MVRHSSDCDMQYQAYYNHKHLQQNMHFSSHQNTDFDLDINLCLNCLNGIWCQWLLVFRLGTTRRLVPVRGTIRSRYRAIRARIWSIRTRIWLMCSTLIRSVWRSTGVSTLVIIPISTITTIPRVVSIAIIPIATIIITTRRSMVTGSTGAVITTWVPRSAIRTIRLPVSSENKFFISPISDWAVSVNMI